jgi:hypothetical protein
MLFRFGFDTQRQTVLTLGSVSALLTLTLTAPALILAAIG